MKSGIPANTNQYKYIFGPVLSRRLGISLGIDVIPFKTCPLNCIYCECGKTTHHTVEIQEYIPTNEIIKELDQYLSDTPNLDVITFAGSGEPCLNKAIDPVNKHIKKQYPQYKTVLLTNSILFMDEEIRQAALAFDYVLPSLDTVNQNSFEKINCPIPGLKIDSIITGLVTFAQEYTGILWIEVFIIPGINDTDEELDLLKNILLSINPTRVQINTLDRPGTCSQIKPATSEQLEKIAKKLLPLPVEIISRKAYTLSMNTKSNNHNLSTLLTSIKRRPMTIEDLAIYLNENINNTYTLIKPLIDDHKIIKKKVDNTYFYSCSY